MAHRTSKQGETAKAGGLVAAGAVIAIFFAGIVPLILSGYDRGRGAFDQAVFHLPVIRNFAATFPHLDFSDYSSGTTPGFHVAVAMIARYFTDDLHVLRLAGAVFSLGLLATLAIAVGKRVGTISAVVLCLPVMASLYVVSSAVWLLPDNAGWWGVLGLLLISLRRPFDGWTFVFSSLLFLALVSVRQSHVWVLAPMLSAAWLGGEDETANLLQIHAARVWRILLMAVAVLPGLLVLGYFFHLWHGMAPPNQRALVAGGNAAGPAMALATAGALGIFYWPVRMAKAGGSRLGVPALIGAGIGLAIGIPPHTTYDVLSGRYSGLWNISRNFPSYGGRSSYMIALCVLGGMVIAIWLASMPMRRRIIWASAIAAFIAAQAVTHYAAQRYDEPLVLIVAALAVSQSASRPSRLALIGPMLLFFLLLGITVLALRV